MVSTNFFIPNQRLLNKMQHYVFVSVLFPKVTAEHKIVRLSLVNLNFNIIKYLNPKCFNTHAY